MRGDSASTLSSTFGAVVPLVDGRLYALTLPYDLSRDTSTHPRGSSGYSTVNCYLLKEGSRQLLVDTGFPAQADALFAMLDDLLEPSSGLSVMPLRAGEVGSLGNVVPLASRYELDDLYCILPREFVWDMDVRSKASRAHDRADARQPRSILFGGSNLLGAAKAKLFPLGADNTRRLEWFKPMLQLLIQMWLYDEDTRTIFTSEVFGHTSRESPSGPWTIEDPAEDPMTEDDLTDFLRASNRFWWLAGADGVRIAGWLRDVFDTRPVERIAPGFGCIFEGRAVVERQVDLLSRTLTRLSSEPRHNAETAR